MKQIILACILFACLNGSGVSASGGQNMSITDSIDTVAPVLNDVVISASREKQLRKDVPAAITKIDPQIIKETRATALYQLLNKAAGVYMVNLGNEQHTMAIRQPVSYNALYLYMEDGVPIRPTGIFNHNALYEINMNGLKDIEVLKGPSSSLYGSNAIGGAVNFITADPLASTGNEVSVQGDGYHYYRGDVSAGYSSAKTGVYLSGYAARQNDSWQDYTNFDKYSASLKVTHVLGALTRLGFSATYSYLDTQTPGSLDSSRFYSRSYGSNQRFTYRRVNAFRASSRLDHDWNGKSRSFLTFFFRNNSTGQLPAYYLQDVRDASGQYLRSSGQENNQSFHSYGLLLQHSLDMSFLKSQLIAGVYVDHSPSSFYADALDVYKDRSSNTYTGYSNTGVLIDDYRMRLLNTAAYVQYLIRPTQKLRLVGGLRYDRVTYHFSNRLPAERTKYKQQETNEFNVVAPKLGATYDLGKGAGLYATVSAGFQPPETSNLYSSRQTTALKQATFYNYEAGGWTAARNGNVRVEMSVYNMEGRNEIISVLMADGSTQNQNAGATRHLGVEYQVSWKPLPQLALRLSGTNARHTYLNYSEVSAGKSVNYDGKRMSNAPAFIANSEVTYRPNFFSGFRASLEWQHLSGYYTNSANTRDYDGYELLNFRTGYDFKKSFAKGAGLWINILNLGDVLYASNVMTNQYGATYNAAPPRTVSIGLTYHLRRNDD
ncbi:TonB-dependent receptor family protein [Arcticibacter sp. MXS-1]|uniref:TonB-dependent receptor family protein n=1 Tax=Arcticibacter sp. MXS-1 TaxID=3341726 RepID=UPI0035A93293